MGRWVSGGGVHTESGRVRTRTVALSVSISFPLCLCLSHSRSLVHSLSLPLSLSLALALALSFSLCQLLQVGGKQYRQYCNAVGDSAREGYDYLRELTCSKWVEPEVDGLPVFLPWPISAGGHFQSGDGGRELLPEPVGETEWYIPHGKIGE